MKSGEMSILAISSDPVVLTALAGTQHVSAGTLQEALEQLARIQPDAILLDLFLPDSQGLATLQTLRRQAPQLPVVALVPPGEWQLALASLRHGAHDCLLKVQLDASELETTMAHALQRQRAINHPAKTGPETSQGILQMGLIHDINNLLASTLDNLLLAEAAAPAGAPGRPFLAKARKAALAAVELANQLWSYAGRDTLDVSQLDLTETVRETLKVLNHRFSEHITLELSLTPHLFLRTNPVRLRQVVMNLLINAREAVGDGPGVIRIATGTRQLDPAEAGLDFLGNPPGSGLYRYLAVADDGRGIAPEAQALLLTPFFTTKPGGQGLGLAIVQAIVQDCGGALRITSTPGEGALFEVFFPAVP